MATRNPTDLLAHKPLSSDPFWVKTSGGPFVGGVGMYPNFSGVLGSGEANYFDFSQELVSFAQPQYSYSKFDGTENFAPVMFLEGKVLYWWESGVNDGGSLDGGISNVTENSFKDGSKDFTNVAGALITTFGNDGGQKQKTVATGGDASGTVTVAGWPDGTGNVGSRYVMSFAGDEGASGIGVRNIWVSPHPSSGFYWDGVARSDTAMMILNSGINQSLVYWNKLESDLSSAIKSRKTVHDQYIDAYTVSGEIVESSGMAPYYEDGESNPTVFNPYIHYQKYKRSKRNIVGRSKHNRNAISIPPAILFQTDPSIPLPHKGYSITGGGLKNSFAGSWVPYEMSAPYHGKSPYPVEEEEPKPEPPPADEKYSCIDGECQPDKEGEYSSLSECLSAGCGGRYSCVDGECQPDEDGEYSSLSECITACQSKHKDDPVDTPVPVDTEEEEEEEDEVECDDVSASLDGTGEIPLGAITNVSFTFSGWMEGADGDMVWGIATGDGSIIKNGAIGWRPSVTGNKGSIWIEGLALGDAKILVEANVECENKKTKEKEIQRQQRSFNIKVVN